MRHQQQLDSEQHMICGAMSGVREDIVHAGKRQQDNRRHHDRPKTSRRSLVQQLAGFRRKSMRRGRHHQPTVKHSSDQCGNRGDVQPAHRHIQSFGIHTDEYTIGFMIHEILPVGLLACNCSIFGDEQTREALVVDPGDDIARILEIVARHGLTVKGIVITHAHIDHIGGAQRLKQATGAPVYMNSADSELQRMMDVQASWLGMKTPESVEIDSAASDGASIVAGSTEFHVLHTPGHTPGSISLWIPSEGKLVAGDTLFRGSIGRTDLPGGDGRQILRSIHEKLLALPDETVVIPGHGEITTIGHEREFNFFLQELTR